MSNLDFYMRPLANPIFIVKTLQIRHFSNPYFTNLSRRNIPFWALPVCPEAISVSHSIRPGVGVIIGGSR
jgi:hypothetical protein